MSEPRCGAVDPDESKPASEQHDAGAEQAIRTFCPECGPHIGIDEDGCCVTCGATATGSAVDQLRAEQERKAVTWVDQVRRKTPLLFEIERQKLRAEEAEIEVDCLRAENDLLRREAQYQREERARQAMLALNELNALRRRLAEVEEALPRTGDGVPILPGMTVYSEYLGDVWEARVTGVGPGWIDIQYTTDAGHRAKGVTRRRVDPAGWFAHRSVVEDRAAARRLLEERTP